MWLWLVRVQRGSPWFDAPKNLSSFSGEVFWLAHHVVSKAFVYALAAPNHINPRRIMWHVYIIKCSDGSLYTGTTTDVSRRVKAHNEKSGGSYTRTRAPVKLVYQEPCSNQSSALKREAQIKRWTKEKKLALINGNISHLHDLSKSHD